MLHAPTAWAKDVVPMLDVKSVARMGQTCKAWRDELEHDLPWSKLFNVQYGMHPVTPNAISSKSMVRKMQERRSQRWRTIPSNRTPAGKQGHGMVRFAARNARERAPMPPPQTKDLGKHGVRRGETVVVFGGNSNGSLSAGLQVCHIVAKDGPSHTHGQEVATAASTAT